MENVAGLPLYSSPTGELSVACYAVLNLIMRMSRLLKMDMNSLQSVSLWPYFLLQIIVVNLTMRVLWWVWTTPWRVHFRSSNHQTRKERWVLATNYWSLELHRGRYSGNYQINGLFDLVDDIESSNCGSYYHQHTQDMLVFQTVFNKSNNDAIGWLFRLMGVI